MWFVCICFCCGACEESQSSTMTVQDEGVAILLLADATTYEMQDEADQTHTMHTQDMGTWSNQDARVWEEDQSISVPDQTIVDPLDRDADGISNGEDNCPDVYNPSQSDFDRNDMGDACESDADGDGIPDEWDPAPQDASWPGRTLADTVYAHTAGELYALDIKSTRPFLIAPFTFETDPALITDIAINRAGVLWAISYDTIYICHAQEAYCKPQGYLADENLNGLTFIHGSVYEQEQDVLIGIDEFGTWYALSNDGFGGVFNSESIGRYTLGDRSSGDAFYIDEVGTFASVKRSGEASDVIVSLDPRRIFLADDLLFLDGYSKVYGLAGWRGLLFAFDESGAILRINLQDLSFELLGNEGLSWWGAGVSSVLYSTMEE